MLFMLQSFWNYSANQISFYRKASIINIENKKHNIYNTNRENVRQADSVSSILNTKYHETYILLIIFELSLK